VRPCRLAVPERDLDLLRQRLRATRWPDPETVTDWSQGVPVDALRDLVDHWTHRYDWRRDEARINAWPQYVVELDALRVHVLVAVSPHPNAVPVLMTHGWPSSIVEFLDVLPRLTDPTIDGGDVADACTVICPSLPGFGFSEAPHETGWDVHRIARAWSELMPMLGYHRYVVQGGDWGSAVGTSMAQQRPQPITGLHLTMPSGGATGRRAPTGRAGQLLAELGADRGFDLDYHAQHTRFPQTIGYALTDSPVALTAWLWQRFQNWVDHDGDLFDVLDRDDFLANLMLYWLPAAGASSGRIYWESRSTRTDPVRVPTGFSLFAKDFPHPSRRAVAQVYPEIVSWQTVPRGGHFPAWEQPDAFVTQLRGFLGRLRQDGHLTPEPAVSA
jgi:pimeloyl-ACP methyl ester carboxylesterase